MWTLCPDYINNLSFDYIETYTIRKEAENEPIVESANEFYFPCSIKTNTFQHDHPVTEQIKQILQFGIEHQFKMLCAPVYRDAIVFYDQNHQTVSCLSICLTCFYLRTENLQLQADYKTYGYLKKLFIELGHNVQNPAYNIIDEVEVMKKKIKKPKR